MTAALRARQRAGRPTYQIVERTTHVRIINGRQYVDVIARRSGDDTLRLVSLPLDH